VFFNTLDFLQLFTVQQTLAYVFYSHK